MHLWGLQFRGQTRVGRLLSTFITSDSGRLSFRRRINQETKQLDLSRLSPLGSTTVLPEPRSTRRVEWESCVWNLQLSLMSRDRSVAPFPPLAIRPRGHDRNVEGHLKVKFYFPMLHVSPRYFRNPSVHSRGILSERLFRQTFTLPHEISVGSEGS